MSQTKEVVEALALAFKGANEDWMDVEWKKKLVDNLNSQLAAKSRAEGDKRAVYGVIVPKGEELAVIGTAFAVSTSLALSAWQHFSKCGYKSGDTVRLCQEFDGRVTRAISHVVAVLEYDETDDWVTLQLVLGEFSHHVALCPEAELPPESDGPGLSRYLGVMDFSAGFPNFRNRHTVRCMDGKIWNYSAKLTDQKDQTIQLLDFFPVELHDTVNVRVDRVVGSGAPYFAANGKVIAFNVKPLFYTDNRFAGYNVGHVPARLQSFLSKYPQLF